jgi:trehalose/maltose hydrolase-like predicted phosphorylase
MDGATMKTWTLEQEIGIYAKYVGWIHVEEENWETFAWEALIIRSSLQEQWNELTPAQQRQVEQADEVLSQCVRQLQEILPSYGEHPRSEWWWFLHEGPQVREAALRFA